MLEKAIAFAHKAHEGQTRWDGSPYINHPKSVAKRITEKGFSESVIILGWLHDVVEDCNITIERIEKEFNGDTAYYLDFLTHKSIESYTEYILRVSGNTTASVVKICDLEDNLSDLDPKKQKQRIDKYELAKLFLGRSLGCGF